MDGSRHPHGAHAGVVHAGNREPHSNARNDERVRPPTYNDERGCRDQDGNGKREEREERIVGNIHAGQAKGQHGHEMHGPDAAAHGDCRSSEPAQAGEA